jgi:biopolymer transport protein ExbD
MKFDVDPLPEENSVVIDLTSMIDVLFVLLLFFMVTTTFSETSSMNVKLPSASAKATQITKKDLSVSLDSKGDISFSENSAPTRKIPLEGLKDELLKAKQSNTNVSLILRADKEVNHGRVVTVLDQAKQVGIENIAIGTITEMPK